MDEEARKRKRLFAGEKKESMSRRLDGHDYRARSIYLITMVTEGRQPLFGEVVGDVHLPFGYPDAPHTVPTTLGEAIFANWQGMLARFPDLRGIAFQLMPDHFHAILFVTDHILRHIGNILNGFKAGCRHAFHTIHPVLYDAAVQRQHPDAYRQDREHGILFALNTTIRFSFVKASSTTGYATLLTIPAGFLLSVNTLSSFVYSVR